MYLSDKPNELVLRNIQASITTNNLNDRVSFVPIMWGEYSGALTDLQYVDLVLASDCLYDSKDFTAFFATVAFLLQKHAGARVIAAYQHRSANRTLEPYLIRFHLACTVLSKAELLGGLDPEGGVMLPLSPALTLQHWTMCRCRRCSCWNFGWHEAIQTSERRKQQNRVSPLFVASFLSHSTSRKPRHGRILASIPASIPASITACCPGWHCRSPMLKGPALHQMPVRLLITSRILFGLIADNPISNLPNLDIGSKSDPLVVVTLKSARTAGQFTEVGLLLYDVEDDNLVVVVVVVVCDVTMRVIHGLYKC